MSLARDDLIDRARSERIEHVLAQRGVMRMLRGRHAKFAGPCPVCGGIDRFAVHLGKQAFHCRGCGGGGGGAISLVMWLDGSDFLRAVETLVGPLPDDEQPETEAECRAREQRNRERREQIERERIEREESRTAQYTAEIAACDAVWAETEPLPEQAIAYLTNDARAGGRGIRLDMVPHQGGLRWHPAMPQWIESNAPTRPSIVTRYSDPLTGELRGIWHRPPTKLIKPKTFGPMLRPYDDDNPTKLRSAVIRLWPDEAIEQAIVAGEGVETMLAAATRITYRGTLLQPAWACGCRTNLRDLPILPGIDYLTVCADNDASGHGQRDARVCAQRWADAGIDVEVLIPDEIDEDFADIASAS